MVILAIQYFLGSHSYHILDIDKGCIVLKYYDKEAHGYNYHVIADRAVIFLITKGEREMAKGCRPKKTQYIYRHYPN